jgi:hypothetical protein
LVSSEAATGCQAHCNKWTAGAQELTPQTCCRRRPLHAGAAGGGGCCRRCLLETGVSLAPSQPSPLPTAAAALLLQAGSVPGGQSTRRAAGAAAARSWRGSGSCGPRPTARPGRAGATPGGWRVGGGHARDAHPRAPSGAASEAAAAAGRARTARRTCAAVCRPAGPPLGHAAARRSTSGSSS